MAQHGTAQRSAAHLARAAHGAGQGVGSGQAQVVLAVGGDDHIVGARGVGLDLGNQALHGGMNKRGILGLRAVRGAEAEAGRQRCRRAPEIGTSWANRQRERADTQLARSTVGAQVQPPA